MRNRAIEIIVGEMDMDFNEVEETAAGIFSISDKAWFRTAEDRTKAEKAVVDALQGWGLRFDHGYQRPDWVVKENETPRCHWSRVVVTPPADKVEEFRTALGDSLV